MSKNKLGKDSNLLKNEVKQVGIYFGFLVLMIVFWFLAAHLYSSLGIISHNCLENERSHTIYNYLDYIINFFRFGSCLVILVVMGKRVFFEKNKISIRIIRLIECTLLIIGVLLFWTGIEFLISYVFGLDSSYWWCVAK